MDDGLTGELRDSGPASDEKPPSRRRGLRRSTLTLLPVVALMAVAFGAAFAFGKYAGDGQLASAAHDNEAPPADVASPPPVPDDGTEPENEPTPPHGGVGQDNPPGPDVTPEPGATPDTTLTFWWVPYENADRKMPVKTLTLNGITVGPDVERVQQQCPTQLSTVPLEDVASDPVGINLKAIPPAATIAFRNAVDGGVGTVCEGEVVSSGVLFTFEADIANEFFGGAIQILRWLGPPQIASSIPAYRWSEGSIAGQPAALARPILPDIGLGAAAVIVHNAGVTTMLRAEGIPMDMLIEIAEEVLR